MADHVISLIGQVLFIVFTGWLSLLAYGLGVLLVLLVLILLVFLGYYIIDRLH